MTFTLSNESARSMSASKGADAANEILLRRFAKTGDGEAFAELVQRLGPMVLGICRRSIADYQLAEGCDAGGVFGAGAEAGGRACAGDGGWVYVWSCRSDCQKGSRDDSSTPRPLAARF